MAEEVRSLPHAHRPQASSLVTRQQAEPPSNSQARHAAVPTHIHHTQPCFFSCCCCAAASQQSLTLPKQSHTRSCQVRSVLQPIACAGCPASVLNSAPCQHTPHTAAPCQHTTHTGHTRTHACMHARMHTHRGTHTEAQTERERHSTNRSHLSSAPASRLDAPPDIAGPTCAGICNTHHPCCCCEPPQPLPQTPTTTAHQQPAQPYADAKQALECVHATTQPCKSKPTMHVHATRTHTQHTCHAAAQHNTSSSNRGRLGSCRRTQLGASRRHSLPACCLLRGSATLLV